MSVTPAGVTNAGGKFTAGVINTNGKFTAGVINTGGEFTAGVIDTGGKFTAGVIMDPHDLLSSREADPVSSKITLQPNS